MKAATIKNIQVGSTVYVKRKIKELSIGRDCPILLDNGETYFPDGKYYDSDEEPQLFIEEPEWIVREMFIWDYDESSAELEVVHGMFNGQYMIKSKDGDYLGYKYAKEANKEETVSIEIPKSKVEEVENFLRTLNN